MSQGDIFSAFLSYAHINDEHDNGQITVFRKLLEMEMALHKPSLQPPFQIFQDVRDISWGQEWRERLFNILDECTFFIPVITPSYLCSEVCRSEFKYFLSNANNKKVVLPLLYMDTPELSDESDSIALEINKRQWDDWRELRFEDPNSRKMKKRLNALADKIIGFLAEKDEEAEKLIGNVPGTIITNPITNEKIEAYDAYTESERVSAARLEEIRRILPPLFQQTDENECPSRLITVSMRPSGNFERDKRTLKNIHGVLIAYPGKDKFSLQVYEGERGHLIDFPYDTTRICPEMLTRLKIILGDENWRIEEIGV